MTISRADDLQARLLKLEKIPLTCPPSTNSIYPYLACRNSSFTRCTVHGSTRESFVSKETCVKSYLRDVRTRTGLLEHTNHFKLLDIFHSVFPTSSAIIQTPQLTSMFIIDHSPTSVQSQQESAPEK